MRRLALVSSALVLGATLCGCTKAPTSTTASASSTGVTDGADPSASPVPDIRPTCAKEIRSQIRCKQDFVPMLVDTRIKLDLPPGIAVEGRDKAGRDALVVVAMQEFDVDYTPSKIETICERRQAQVMKMPPEVLEELTALNGNCHAEDDCKRFASCVAPMLERMLAMGANSGAH